MNQQPVDEDLVILLKTGDEAAFRQIYKRYWKELFNNAFQKTGSRETAEELVQNLFVSIWKNHETTNIQNLRSCLKTKE